MDRRRTSKSHFSKRPKWHPLQKIWTGEKFLMRFFKAPPLFHQMMRCVLEEENGNLGNWFFSNPLCAFAAAHQPYSIHKYCTHMTTAIIRVQYWWCYAAPLHIKTKDNVPQAFFANFRFKTYFRWKSSILEVILYFLRLSRVVTGIIARDLRCILADNNLCYQ